MNITMKCYQPGHIEELRRNRPLVRSISPQIKSLSGRVGKNAVIGVVEIWEFDSRPGLDWKQWRNKSEILLRNLFGRRRHRFRKGTFKVNHGQRRLGRENAAMGNDLVALRHHRRRMRWGQFYSSFDRRIGEP